MNNGMSYNDMLASDTSVKNLEERIEENERIRVLLFKAHKLDSDNSSMVRLIMDVVGEINDLKLRIKRIKKRS